MEWFLAQNDRVQGYTRAIYSGFTTLELAKIIERYVLPNDDLTGLYHVSSEPINKNDLLRLIAQRYGKEIDIGPYDGFVCDRSLDSSRFRGVTGYSPVPWPEMIHEMWRDYTETPRR